MKNFYLLLASLWLTAGVMAESGAQWGNKNAQELRKFDHQHYAALAADDAALNALLEAAAKPAYTADPLTLTRLAGYSQYVRQPAGQAHQKKLADKLLAACVQASDAYIKLCFLDQLRWVGYPQQSAGLKTLAADNDQAVAAMADLLIRTLEQKAEPPVPTVTAYAQLRQDILKLPDAERTAALLKAFDHSDIGMAGVAMALAQQAGDAKATLAWAQKYATLKDPARKIMILDMFALRGDNNAKQTFLAALADDDDAVVTAAHNAWVALDKTSYASHLPSILQNLSAAQVPQVQNAMRQLNTSLLRQALTYTYVKFSPAGKLVALTLFKERNVAEATNMAMQAMSEADQNLAIIGLQLLRETAGPPQAPAIIEQLLKAQGRRAQETQNTIVAAAKRHAPAYTAAVNLAFEKANDAHKELLLECAARIGGAPLLQTTLTAATGDNQNLATAAVRALANWSDDGAIPALIQIAVHDPNARHQKLALRGIETIANKQADITAKYGSAWLNLRQKAGGNEEHKQKLAAIFSGATNIVLNKQVTTDQPTEGNHIPANMVDGNVDTAWYGGGSPANAVIDLAGEFTVNAYHVIFYNQDRRTYTFKIELSGDGKEWHEVASNVADPQPSTAEGFKGEFPPRKARFAKLVVLKNSANPAVHVQEFKLFSEVK